MIDNSCMEAELVAGDQTVPVRAKYSSRYSLWVQFANGYEFPEGTEFSRLVMEVKESRLDLGRCRLIKEANIDGFDGRLIFIDDIYDFESLFKGREVIKLQSSFQNLQLVLPYKEKIKREFKDYTSDLTYDLSIYKSVFDRVDHEYAAEPQHIRGLVQKAILYTEGRKFMRFMDDRLEELKSLVKGFTREEHERHGFFFRRQVWHHILCSRLMARSNLKPRGYSGDSAMMEMLYRNEYLGDTTFEKLMHKHPCENAAAQAVRNRRSLVVRKLGEFYTRRAPADGERLQVLSVACGSAFELRDILAGAADARKYHFALFDQDSKALYTAATWISQWEKELGLKIHVEYINESVRTMMAAADQPDRTGRYDFIYSMGLFDYLIPPVARAVLGVLVSCLKPGGELLIGNYHVDNIDRYYMEYWGDWVLYYRTQADFEAMLPDDDRLQADILFEDTRSQMFLHLRKPPE